MVYNLLVSLPIAAHLILAAYIAPKIGKSIVLTKKQKRINIILVVLIPFVWSVLMYYVLKKEPNYFDKRKHISNDSSASLGDLINLPSDHHFPS